MDSPPAAAWALLWGAAGVGALAVSAGLLYDAPENWVWVSGFWSLAILGTLARRMQRAFHGDGAPAGFGAGRGVRRITDDALPGVVLEISDVWPGRTRLRVAAPAMLPLPGPARLAPRAIRPGKQLSASFADLVWTGRGAGELGRGTEHLQAPLRALWGFRDRYTLQAMLTPFGLMVHMPLVAAHPNEEAFLMAQARALYHGLARMAGAPGVAGVALQSPVAEPAGECSTCWDTVPARDAVHCPACGGRQHADCFAYTGGCGRFACDGVDPLAASLRAARR